MNDKIVQEAGARSFLKVLDAETDPQKRVNMVASALFNDLKQVGVNPHCHFLLNGSAEEGQGLFAMIVGSQEQLMFLFLKLFDQSDAMLGLIQESIKIYEKSKSDGHLGKN